MQLRFGIELFPTPVDYTEQVICKKNDFCRFVRARKHNVPM